MAKDKKEKKEIKIEKVEKKQEPKSDNVISSEGNPV